MDKEPVNDVSIMYPNRRGFIMLAYTIQNLFTRRTGKTARLEEHRDGHFAVAINSTTVYDCVPQQVDEVDQARIIGTLSTYKLPDLKIPVSATLPDDSKDPDHRQWLNSICSGE